jgi:prepilin-type N-terminal cleavage/methylation domain-containing protein
MSLAGLNFALTFGLYCEPVRAGFTVIEILVVMVIIAILSAVIFAVAGGVRASALRSSCVQNLSQIGKAIDLYAGDYNDMMPPVITDTITTDVDGLKDTGVEIKGEPEKWKELLVAYVKEDSIFYCPQDKHARSEERIRTWGADRTNRHTSYEVFLAPEWIVAADGAISLQKSQASSTIPYLRDVTLRSLDKDLDYPYATSHGEWINELFLDGRAKSVRLTD